MLIRIPICFHRRSGPAAASKSSVKPGHQVRDRQRLVERETELEACLAQVETFLARKDSPVRIEDDELILSSLEAERRPCQRRSP